MKKPDLQNNTTLRLRSFGLNFDVFLPNLKSPWNSHPHPPETLQWAVAMQGSKGYIQGSMSGTSNIANDDECTAGEIWNIALYEHVKIHMLEWSPPNTLNKIWSRMSRKMVDENHPVELRCRQHSAIIRWDIYLINSFRILSYETSLGWIPPTGPRGHLYIYTSIYIDHYIFLSLRYVFPKVLVSWKFKFGTRVASIGLHNDVQSSWVSLVSMSCIRYNGITYSPHSTHMNMFFHFSFPFSKNGKQDLICIYLYIWGRIQVYDTSGA